MKDWNATAQVLLDKEQFETLLLHNPQPQFSLAHL